MTDFSGPLFGRRFTGEVFPVEYAGILTLTGLAHTADGQLTGSFAATGTETRTLLVQIAPPSPEHPNGQHEWRSFTATFAVPPTPFSTPFANTGFDQATTLPLPLAQIAAGMAIEQHAAGFRFVDTEYPVISDRSLHAEWRGSGATGSFFLTADLARTSPVHSLDWVREHNPAQPSVILPYPHEGDSGTTLLPYDILRDRGVDQPGSIAWWVEPHGLHPAGPEDFHGGIYPSGIASFAPGQASIRIHLPVAGDRIAERNEGYVVRIAAPPGALAHGTETQTGEIFNDDAPPAIRLVAVALDRPEDAGDFAFAMERSGNLDQPSAIAWQTFPGGGRGSATGADFAGGVLPSGIVLFAPGESWVTVPLDVIANATDGPDRSFGIYAPPSENFSGAAIGAIIRDNRAPPSPAEIVAATPSGPLAVAPRWYDGPVWELEKEIILLDTADITLVATTPNWFLRTGPGNDAIAASTGINVIDGGTGSNFLSGQGTDTFFVDARGLSAPVWSTVPNLEPGDFVNIWVDTAWGATLIWEDDQGAEGYRGLTLHVAQPGRPFASLTLPGFTRADAEAWPPELRKIGAWQGGVTSDSAYFISVGVNPNLWP